ncbi:TRAP-type mannitol/chloroaromatic compound transport system, substrate-binding protein [Allopseudospirillum japonicum]|uniref:TRAP-type mannitol/chloroaromatic compound transport system, substrate-binding protein n=1 Tax=Allopseudospirillum japonicum TaxID=64971 RepID=A0A1H6QZY2_9GAMM|nr:TRAP transporter substrate-binding protein [Allopseudospirillum japonicum]SEI44512.1 TRAP-type mannitol/chloroaromatic compound transport system, substrate-binding protein [Allopseudospirillum japonicum]
MERRQFITALGVGAAGALVAGCQDKTPASAPAQVAPAKNETFEWKMVTSWPKNFPGLGTSANYLADTITRMSGGRLKVKVYGAGELVPALEVFDAVSQGTAQMGHSASYYWKGKAPAAQFFCAVPFGLNAQEINSWIHYGGGMELWKEVYAPFGLIPTTAGNTGVQMAGWFNKEINSLEDLKGLKMRIPGLGGEVLNRIGGTAVSLPGGELFTALKTGAIDATEWVGPYNDLAFGLHQAAKYYYYPGWHEPGSAMECMINQKAFEQLPEDLQQIVMTATRAATQTMMDELTFRNAQALDELVNKHGVELRELPQDAYRQLRTLSEEVVFEQAKQSDLTRRVYDSFIAFRDQIERYQSISERAFLNGRFDTNFKAQ